MYCSGRILRSKVNMQLACLIRGNSTEKGDHHLQVDDEEKVEFSLFAEADYEVVDQE